MKTIKYFIAALMVSAAFASCSDETPQLGGEGTVTLSTTISHEMTIESRAVENEDEIANAKLWISSEKGLVRRYDGIENFPGMLEPIKLNTGHYVAELWAGDSVPASFDTRWFKGREEFDVIADNNTSLSITATIANTAVSVKYMEDLTNILSDIKLTVGHSKGELVYEGTADQGKRGYFMMPSTDKELTYVLTATNSNGQPFRFEGSIQAPKPATEYILNVTYSIDQAMGGALITITIDENSIEFIQDNVTVISAPVITGDGIENPVIKKPGEVGDLQVFALSALQLESLVLSSDLLTPIIGNATCSVTKMNIDLQSKFETAGIFVTQKNVDGGYRVRVRFDEKYTNSLPEGEYRIEFTATDPDGRTTSKTMRLTVGEIPIIAEDVPQSEIGFTTLPLHGKVNPEMIPMSRVTIAGYGFEYKLATEDSFTYIEGDVQGEDIYVTLTGLTPGAAYQWRPVAGEYKGPITTTSTRAHLQLPNAGFEDWCKVGKPLVPARSADELFWDTGNHGSQKMSKNVTDYDENIKHSGKYSARLKSQFVGVGTLGKFAAGNIFIGKYLHTDGTDGELGWGRPFDDRPIAVKLWVRYEPKKAVKNKGASNDYIAQDQLDQGIIYVALTNNDTQLYSNKDSDANGTSWPFIIKTKSQQLFKDSNGNLRDNVLAYGEHIFTEATEGSGMVQITIPLDPKDGITINEGDVANIVFVASASRYGDYFSGGDGSTMWLDDIELIYE